jgi:hypothetical protein
MSLDSVAPEGNDFKGSAGRKRRANKGNASPREANEATVLKRSDPYDTAGVFRQYGISGKLIHYRGDFYTWTGSHYRKAEDGEIRALLYSFLNEAVVVVQDDDNGSTKLQPFCPDDRAVNKVIDALKARSRVSSDLQTPAWLPGASPEMRGHKPAEPPALQQRIVGPDEGQAATPHTRLSDDERCVSNDIRN